MAASKEAKAAIGNMKLQPYYVGVSEHKTLAGKAFKHTHYVLIRSQVAKRLGITKTQIIKPGTDSSVDGVIFENQRKGKNNKRHVAKRFLTLYASGTKSSKTIEAYLDTNPRIKTKSGELVSESYIISFPSSIPLRMIVDFFKKNCPKVTRLNTGSNFYRIR
jgi:hypothetical protein